jgi:dolichol-phosphate mannosyltransferase
MHANASIIVPTYNERENIKPLVEGLFKAAVDADIKLEVIIVDDSSPDGTGEAAEELGGRFNVRVLRRPGKLGLATAVIDGIKAASSDVVGVMDADLSHNPTAFPKVAEPVIKGLAELAVGSRYVPGGSTIDWGAGRRIISATARLLSRPLTDVKDPMSGFFFTRKNVINRAELKPVGFKILLEVIVKCSPKNVVEVPIEFRDRRHGASKLDVRENINYLLHLMRLYSFKLGLKSNTPPKGGV